MSLLLRWRVPARSVETRWRGPQGALAAIAARPNAPLAAFVVPSANATVTEGDGIEVIGNEVRVNIDALPSAPGV